ncbi:hypothetical protein Gogos_003050 [Gossypium gossypioides]|uniref:DUF4283 domain-containing protein n=1 Tax=Gossypium gossypioides TaxID=34282 RepID=A0A7J9CKS9_GOSGO|nr:hypothetical protein [Gossypium gossypioides]
MTVPVTDVGMLAKQAYMLYGIVGGANRVWIKLVPHELHNFLLKRSVVTIEEELANLNIVDEEEDYKLCLVGRVLTDSMVHFLSMRNTLVDLWHPLEGVSITDIMEKGSLFQFYYEIDLKRVIDGMP